MLMVRNLIDIAGTQAVERIQPHDAQQRSNEYQRLLAEQNFPEPKQEEQIMPSLSKSDVSSTKTRQVDLDLLHSITRQVKASFQRPASEIESVGDLVISPPKKL
jgi:tRNA C32,U32 (ribose-2'-O)-methylase TrmJ